MISVSNMAVFFSFKSLCSYHVKRPFLALGTRWAGSSDWAVTIAPTDQLPRANRHRAFRCRLRDKRWNIEFFITHTFLFVRINEFISNKFGTCVWNIIYAILETLTFLTRLARREPLLANILLDAEGRLGHGRRRQLAPH